MTNIYKQKIYMRELIKKILSEDLKYYAKSNNNSNSNEYKIGVKENEGNTILAYHGSRDKFKSFSDKFIGAKKAREQEGPGVYFTTEPEDAINYAKDGGYLYKVELNVGNLISNEPTNNLKHIVKPITKLITSAPNWKRVAKGYSEYDDEALDEILYKYIGMSRSEKEAFVGVYNELYSSTPINYVKNMVKLGYDGVYLPIKTGGAHIAIYNIKTIRILDIKEY